MSKRKLIMLVGSIIGDPNCYGVEFTGENFFITGASDFTISYLYEVSPDGFLLNQYTQPTQNWGTWGWLDLAWDYNYFYAGGCDFLENYIEQIDPIGQPTGVYYGPFPVAPIRAIAYESRTDSFWIASEYGPIYNCYRDGTFEMYPFFSISSKNSGSPIKMQVSFGALQFLL